MANCDTEFFGLVFPGFQATPKIHAQNSRPELSAFLSNFTFSDPKFIQGDFLRPKIPCEWKFATKFASECECVRRPQMWERVQMGFGSTGKKRKGPCTKQCAWRKHRSSDARLAEACPPKLRNTVKYSVEEMRPKWPFWKHRAPKMRLGEAQCAHRKHCYPEIPLGSHPTSRVSQMRWLGALRRDV